MSSVLETITRLVEDWKAWRSRTGLPPKKIMKMKQDLNHSQSVDTLKYCFEQAFRPLDDTEDRVPQLRRLVWRCSHALLKSDLFVDVFTERRKQHNIPEPWFLRRVYRRIWRLYL